MPLKPGQHQLVLHYDLTKRDEASQPLVKLGIPAKLFSCRHQLPVGQAIAEWKGFNFWELTKQFGFYVLNIPLCIHASKGQGSGYLEESSASLLPWGQGRGSTLEPLPASLSH